MDLSIIIAQYDPGNHASCIESFNKTLSQIEFQKGDYEIEVIIADDGSVTHRDIQSLGYPITDQDKRTIYKLKGNALSVWKKENDFNYSSKSSDYQVAWLGINYAENTTTQIGLSLNVASKSSTQIGIVNYSETTNFQVGFLNVTEYLDGIQIGFLNIVLKPTAPYGYVLPFFNMTF